MEKKEIAQKKTDRKKFYRQYLRLIAPIIKLQEKEADVLAMLFFYHDSHLKLPEPIKRKMVFDASTKADIRAELNMSSAHLANIISSLRKKKIILDGDKIHPGILVYLGDDKTFSLTFKSEIE